MAFAFDDTLRQVVLATTVTTRKYRILTECDHVALVIDSRPDHTRDLMSVEAITATGKATLLRTHDETELWSQR